MWVKCMNKVDIEERCSACNCPYVFEWYCPECKEEGFYKDIRTPLDKGVDCCSNCGSEVESIL